MWNFFDEFKHLVAVYEITNYDQGRYDINDPTVGGASGATANFVVGQQDIDPTIYDFANFFSFDLTGITPGSIKSASVEISSRQNVFTPPPNGVFNLYAVPSDPTADPSAFTSGLATDDLIGTVSVPNGGTISSSNPTLSDITVILNATGLADLNAAAGPPGAKFYIGGTFSGPPYVLIPNPGGLTFTNLFNGSGDAAGAVLTASVPEPSTWVMMLIGFAALGFAGYRRVRAARPA